MLGSIICYVGQIYYSLKLERMQRKFLRYLYFRKYAYYPFLYHRAFMLGYVGFTYLLGHVHFYDFKGEIYNPSILKNFKFWIQNVVMEHFFVC